jgi:membrane protein
MAIARPRPPVPAIPRPSDEEASPGKLGGLSVPELGRRVWKEMNEDEIFDRGAGLSYYFLFSFFPMLLFLAALLGLLPIPHLMGQFLVYLQQVLPGDVASLIRKTLHEIVVGAHGGLLSLGMLGALWSASAGVMSMMTALSIAYGVQDDRPWWKRRLMAIGMTVLLAMVILTAMVLLVFGGTIGSRLGGVAGFAWNVLQWPVAIVCVLFGIALLYYLAPAVRQQWRWVTSGSIFALVAWLVLSLGLRFYVSRFANYTVTYGSIGAVILLLLWLYLGGVALLVGAEINSEIEHAAASRGAPDAKRRGDREPRGAPASSAR